MVCEPAHATGSLGLPEVGVSDTLRYNRSLHEYRAAAVHAVDFGRYARLITTLLRSQIGLITFLDEENQFTLAEANQTSSPLLPGKMPHRDTVCQYTVQQSDRPLAVPDLAQDLRFRSLPCVTEGLKLRTYAGYPFTTHEGHNIGAVCALGDQTREWTSEELGILRDIGRMITNDLDLHFKTQAIRLQQRMQSSIATFTRLSLTRTHEGDAEDAESAGASRSKICSNAAELLLGTLEVQGVLVIGLRTIEGSNARPTLRTEMLATLDATQKDGQFDLEYITLAFCQPFLDGSSTTAVFKEEFPPELRGFLGQETSSTLVSCWTTPHGGAAGLLILYTRCPHRTFQEPEVHYVEAFASALTLELQKDELAGADRIKARLISSLSHELRTPLHGLLHNAEVLGESSLDDEQRDLLADIVSCGNAQLSIVESVLNLHDAQQAPSTRPLAHASESCDVLEVVEDSVRLAMTKHRRLVSQSMEMENDMVVFVNCTVGTTTERHFRNRLVDRRCLARIVEQLVSNSLKWTCRGHIEIRVGFITVRSEPVVTVDIHDTGSGISPAFLKRNLYKSFSKEDNFSPGLGLGLSVVAASVSQLGGEVKVQSEKDSHTAVHVALPLRISATEGHMSVTVQDHLTVGITDVPATAPAGSVRLLSILRRDLELLGHKVIILAPGLAEPDVCVILVVQISSEPMNYSDQDIPHIYVGTSVHSDLTLLTGRQGSHHPLGPFYGPYALKNLLTKLMIERPRTSSSIKRRLSTVSQLDTPGPQPKKTVKLLDHSPPKQGEARHQVQKIVEPYRTPIKAALPVRKVSQEPQTALQDGDQAKSGDFSSPRVLIVEDNPTNSRLLARFMLKKGFEFESVVNGQEAVDAVEQSSRHGGNQFDVILMDIQMPILDGLQATEQIRQFETMNDSPKAHIVACTGLSAEEDKHRAALVGCDNFLTKPISLQTLRGLFEDWTLSRAAKSTFSSPRLVDTPV